MRKKPTTSKNDQMNHEGAQNELNAPLCPSPSLDTPQRYPSITLAPTQSLPRHTLVLPQYHHCTKGYFKVLSFLLLPSSSFFLSSTQYQNAACLKAKAALKNNQFLLVLIHNEGLKTHLNSWSHMNLRPDLHYQCSSLRTFFILLRLSFVSLLRSLQKCT